MYVCMLCTKINHRKDALVACMYACLQDCEGIVLVCMYVFVYVCTKFDCHKDALVACMHVCKTVKE